MDIICSFDVEKIYGKEDYLFSLSFSFEVAVYLNP